MTGGSRQRGLREKWMCMYIGLLLLASPKRNMAANMAVSKAPMKPGHDNSLGAIDMTRAVGRLESQGDETAPCAG